MKYPENRLGVRSLGTSFNPDTHKIPHSLTYSWLYRIMNVYRPAKFSPEPNEIGELWIICVPATTVHEAERF